MRRSMSGGRSVKGRRKSKHKPLQPHMEYNHYGEGVAVVRIPKNTPLNLRRQALTDNKKLASAHSYNHWY